MSDQTGKDNEQSPNPQSPKASDEKPPPANKAKGKGEKNDQKQSKESRCGRCDKAIRRLPQLREFCCGCSLKTGVLIIGWLSLIGGCLSFLLDIFLVDYAIDRGDPIGMIAKYACESVVCFILAVLSVVLLYSAYAKRPSCLLISAVAWFTLFLLSLLQAVVAVIINIAVGEPVIDAVLIFGVTLLISGLLFYFTLVIKSFYVQSVHDHK